MKYKIAFILLLLSLTGCVNDSTKETQEEIKSNVIDLDENESNIEDDEIKSTYDSNASVKSKIYKDYFYNQNILPSGRMETYTEGGISYLFGTDIPLASDIIENSHIVKAELNSDYDIIDSAFILTKGTKVLDENITEDIFVHFIYDIKNEELKEFNQENIDGESIESLEFNNEQWLKIAEGYKSLISKIENLNN